MGSRVRATGVYHTKFFSWTKHKARLLLLRVFDTPSLKVIDQTIKRKENGTFEITVDDEVVNKYGHWASDCDARHFAGCRLSSSTETFTGQKTE